MAPVMAEDPKSHSEWLGTRDAAAKLGITLRTLYRFIDEGFVPAYKFGRVIRLKTVDVEDFIEGARVVPGTLKHLYPDMGSSGRPE